MSGLQIKVVTRDLSRPYLSDKGGFYLIGKSVSYKIKPAAGITLRRNGKCCLGNPPQAENPAEQDSILFAGNCRRMENIAEKETKRR